jgi:hypothetical protein
MMNKAKPQSLQAASSANCQALHLSIVAVQQGICNAQHSRASSAAGLAV